MFANGYDIIKGNPVAADYDPGYTSQIFEVTYTQNRSYGAYAEPDNTTVRQQTGCSISGTYTSIASGYVPPLSVITDRQSIAT